MTTSDLYLYGTILGYDLSTPTKIQTFERSVRRQQARDYKRQALKQVVKKYNLPLDSYWSQSRLSIFLRLLKKRQEHQYVTGNDNES